MEVDTMTTPSIEDRLNSLQKFMEICAVPEVPAECPDVVGHLQLYIDNIQKELPQLSETMLWLMSLDWRSSDTGDNPISIETKCRLFTILYEVICPVLPLDLPPILVEYANKLIKQVHHSGFPSTLEAEKLIEFYRVTLKNDKWRTQFGTLHSLLTYLLLKRTLEQHLVSFGLAVGLSVHTSTDMYQKNLSIMIFIHILKRSDSSIISGLNIHAVIYDAIFNDLYNMDNELFVSNVCTCLYQCLEFYDIEDSIRWSLVDDSLEVIARNVMLTSDINIAKEFLMAIGKLGIFFNKHRKTLEENLLTLSIIQWNEDLCLKLLLDNTNFLIYRWAKKIMELLTTISTLCLQQFDTKNQTKLQMVLRLISSCYMIYFMPIPLPIMKPHIYKFYNRCVHNFLELSTKNCTQVVHEIITQFLEIVYYHHLLHFRGIEDTISPLVVGYRDVFSKLLLTPPFINYSKLPKCDYQIIEHKENQEPPIKEFCLLSK